MPKIPSHEDARMNFGEVLYRAKERVATITLNRPARFNAINESMPDDLAAAFAHAVLMCPFCRGGLK